MKTNKVLTVAMLAALTGSMMSSCSVRDNEKTPEIVEDPIKDIVEFYINGKVVDESGNVLANVNVTAEGTEAVKTDNNGNFTLTATEKGSYIVKAELENYIGSNGTEVKIAQSATNRSSVNINITLKKKAENVEVKPSDASKGQVVIVEGGKEENMEKVQQGAAAIEIPKSSVTETFNVTMTEYTPAIESSDNGAAQGVASVTNVNVTTDKKIDANGITLSVKNPDNSQSFKELEVYKVNASRAGQTEEKIGTATYNKESNSYSYKLTKGELSGEYSFKIGYKRNASGVKYELIKQDKKDNSGNFAAIKDYPISYTENAGWKYTSEFSNVSDNVKEMLERLVVSQEGTKGVNQINKEFKTNINGNYIMYFKAENEYTESTYTIELEGKTTKATVKNYKGSKFTYSQEEANQHSGGTGNSGN